MNEMKSVEQLKKWIYEEKRQQFELFADLLIDYNQSVNLTAITQKEEIFVKHFLDSVWGEYAFPQGADVIEIGSGGGFPSLPLKIVRPDLKFTLVESTAKKCEFLKLAIQKLGLEQMQVVNMRAEDGAKNVAFREHYDVACARAVARLNTLCEYCMPFVRVGGVFVAYKGNVDEELKEAQNAVKVLGGRVKRTESFALEEAGLRTVVEIEKIRVTPAAYPRGQGKERKKPL
jgi:16S rRNA (guanine527-N7)-methyltransferase